MPGETPDYGKLNVTIVAFPVTDLGELAVRLGAVSRFDRRGDVIYWTDFSDGLFGWRIAGLGGGATPSLTWQDAYTGGLSARIESGSAAGVGGQILRTHQAPVIDRVGLEATARPDLAFGLWDLTLDYYDGVRRRRFRQRMAWATGVVSVLQADGTYADVLNVGPPQGLQVPWTAAKMVVDLAALRYERSLVGPTAADTRVYEPQDLGASAVFALDLSTEYTEGGLFAPKLAVDSVILTQAEPGEDA